MGFVFGYIDASSGSIVLQAIVGGGLAAIYAGRRFGAQALQATKSWFNRGRQADVNRSNRDTSGD